jgi:hypothetical protein
MTELVVAKARTIKRSTIIGFFRLCIRNLEQAAFLQDL